MECSLAWSGHPQGCWAARRRFRRLRAPHRCAVLLRRVRCRSHARFGGRFLVRWNERVRVELLTGGTTLCS